RARSAEAREADARQGDCAFAADRRPGDTDHYGALRMTDHPVAEQGIVAAAMRAQRLSMLFTALVTVGLAGSIGTFLYYRVTEIHRANTDLATANTTIGKQADTIRQLRELQQTPPVPTPPVPEAPVDFAKLSAGWASGWSARNFEAVMALYAPDPAMLM